MAQRDESIESTLIQPKTLQPQGKRQHFATELQWGGITPKAAAFQVSQRAPHSKPKAVLGSRSPTEPLAPVSPRQGTEGPAGRPLHCRASAFDAGGS